MLRRLALPLVAVLVLVAIGLVSLRLGYLGRADGGPLDTFGGYSTRGTLGKPNQRYVISLPVEVDNDPVRVTRAAPTAISPGVEVRGPRGNRNSNGASGSRRWPPAGDTGRLAGRRSPDGGAVVIPLRAAKPGFYVMDGYDIDYERGARKFRRHLDRTFCFTVRRGSSCRDAEPRLPRSGKLADLGGPSDYGVPVRGRGLSDDGLEARIPAVAGSRRMQITLTNRTDDALDITQLGRTFDVNGLRVRITGPDALTVAPRANATVDLRLRATGCTRDSPGSTEGFGALDATIDGDRTEVPLLIELAFETTDRTARTC